jgi:DNA-binding GntR family transcriptional regulator
VCAGQAELAIMDPMPPRGPELPSRRVEDDLRRRCRAGEWQPGERLPPVAELAQHYGVARNTITKALRRLADDDLVEIVPNWGTFRARQ